MIRILYLGTPEFAAIPLEALARDPRYMLIGVVTQPDRPAARSGIPQPPPVKQRALALAEELGLDLPIFQPATLRDPAVVEQLAALQPDAGVVAAYGEILRRDVLAIPPLGYLNIHPSLLPLYRGPAPLTGAILAGDTETGVTVMLLEAKMDSGPSLAPRRVPLAPDARAGTLTSDLFQLGTELLLEALDGYASSRITPVPQNHDQATFTKLLQKSDGVINWAMPAIQIERMTRAYDPWPGATTTWRGQPLRIIAGCLLEKSPAAAQPGDLFDASGGICVATGAGALELLVVQPAGKRPMAAAEWRRGIQKFTGGRLGT